MSAMLADNFNLSQINFAPSLHLMLNIITNMHFYSPPCIQIPGINPLSIYYPLMSTFAHDLLQYANPDKCTKGCSNYILLSPVDEKYILCMHENHQYFFKGIIFLGNDSITDYYLENMEINKIQPAFVANCIFLQVMGDQIIISAFKDLQLTEHEVLNTWNITGRVFQTEDISEFYSVKRKKRFGGLLNIASSKDFVPFIVGATRKGSELNLLTEFALFLNLTPQLDLIDVSTDLVPRFLMGYFGQEQILPTTYPVSALDLSFLVPIGKVYVDWFKVLCVMKPSLLVLFISCFLIVAIFFHIENYYDPSKKRPQFMAILAILMMQALRREDISSNFRAQFLIAILEVVTVLHSALFASGVVRTLMSVSFKDDLRTMDALAESDLAVEWINDPKHFYDPEEFTVAETKAFSRYVTPGNNLTYDQKAIAEYITITGITTALNTEKEEILIYVESMNYIFIKSYSTIVVSRELYMLYIPLLNDFILRCKDAGLMIKWEWDCFRSENKMSVLLEYLGNDYLKALKEPIKLQYEHIRGVMFVWFFGIIISTGMFILEIVYEVD